MKRVRAGGVCIHNNRILLIHRINKTKPLNEQEYYVIPGGGVEDGENIFEAVKREFLEETDIVVEVRELLCKRETLSTKGFDQHEEYYMCDYISGEPYLKEQTEEYKEMQEGVHFYKPMWVDIAKIKNIIVYPEEVKEEIIEKFL